MASHGLGDEARAILERTERTLLLILSHHAGATLHRFSGGDWSDCFGRPRLFFSLLCSCSLCWSNWGSEDGSRPAEALWRSTSRTPNPRSLGCVITNLRAQKGHVRAPTVNGVDTTIESLWGSKQGAKIRTPSPRRLLGHPFYVRSEGGRRKSRTCDFAGRQPCIHAASGGGVSRVGVVVWVSGLACRKRAWLRRVRFSEPL
jgi:hypothetical protein